MPKLTTQQRLNILAAANIRLCELLEQYFTVAGVLIPEVERSLNSIQELCYQVCPEAHKKDFALCYAAVQGIEFEVNGEFRGETVSVEASG